ncbi:hypothetical protein LSAT2_017896 [Lamellibrachia satsuma]|nr:hypothetical protein LSAT2_017896 [Lamellibrachia satsuma]
MPDKFRRFIAGPLPPASRLPLQCSCNAPSTAVVSVPRSTFPVDTTLSETTREHSHAVSEGPSALGKRLPPAASRFWETDCSFQPASGRPFVAAVYTPHARRRPPGGQQRRNVVLLVCAKQIQSTVALVDWH